MVILRESIARWVRTAIHVVLFALLLVGGVAAWRSGQDRARLRAEYERLHRITGDLAIADPTKVYLRGLSTGEPLHYAWRVYLPPNYSLILKHASGSTSGSPSTKPEEFIARVRLREDEQGILNLYEHFGGGSSRFGIGDKTLAAFVRAHGGAIQVEQLGATDLAVVDPGKSAVLFRMTIPEALRDEAQRTLSPHARSLLPVLFELKLGRDPPKPSSPGG